MTLLFPTHGVVEEGRGASEALKQGTAGVIWDGRRGGEGEGEAGRKVSQKPVLRAEQRRGAARRGERRGEEGGRGGREAGGLERGRRRRIAGLRHQRGALSQELVFQTQRSIVGGQTSPTRDPRLVCLGHVGLLQTQRPHHCRETHESECQRLSEAHKAARHQTWGQAAQQHSYTVDV